VRRQQERPLEHIAELANVPGPLVFPKCIFRRCIETTSSAAQLAGELLKQQGRKRGDIFRTIPQRGDSQRDGVDPEEEILPELLRRDQLRQAVVRRRDETHVDASRTDVAHAPEGLLLDDLEQFGLDDERHVADLVEKHGSAIGGFNQTDLRRGGARERASLIAKEFRLEQVRQQPGTIDVDEWLVGAPARIVQPPREHPLAAACFALNQDWRIAGRDPLGVTVERLNLLSADGERVGGEPAVAPAGCGRHARIAMLLECLGYDREQRGKIAGLGEEVLGPLANRAHGEVDRRLPGQDDERCRRGCGLEVLDQIERRSVGEKVIGEHDIEARGRQHLLRGRHRPARRHVQTGMGQVIADGDANDGLVVDQQNPIATGISGCRVHAWRRRAAVPQDS
jgi:hypothetical protein